MMNEAREKPWLKQPGECHDERGVPIYPGDLLRTPHFTDGRGRRYYLYHTAVYKDGAMWMVPTSHLEPTKANLGGKCLLSQQHASLSRVIHGHGPGGCLNYTDRPRVKVDDLDAAELSIRGLHTCAICQRPTAPTDRSVCEKCIPREPGRLYCDQEPQVYADPKGAGNGIIRVRFADVTLALHLNAASWLAADIGRVMRSVEMSDSDKRRLKPGDKVLVTDDAGVSAEYFVKTAPWQLGHGAWVIGLGGISGGYSLDRVVALVEAGR